MALARSTLIGGPAKIFAASAGVWTPDTIQVRIEPTTNEVAPSLFGRVTEAVNDLVVKVSSFTPFGLWDSTTRGLLFPSYYTSPVMGSRLLGDTDVPWKIWGVGGDMCTISAGAVMKPPSITLSADKPIYGQMDVGGLCANSVDPGSANAFYTMAVAQADPGGVFALTTYKQQLWTAAWGAVTGFTSFESMDGWTIEFVPKLEAVKAQGLTRDYKMMGMTVTAKCIPRGPTQAQMYTAIEDSKLGARIEDKSVGDLTLTGADGTSSIALSNMSLVNRGSAWGSKELRNGECLWKNVVKFTAGAPGALVTFT